MSENNAYRPKRNSTAGIICLTGLGCGVFSPFIGTLNTLCDQFPKLHPETQDTFGWLVAAFVLILLAVQCAARPDRAALSLDKKHLANAERIYWAGAGAALTLFVAMVALPKPEELPTPEQVEMDALFILATVIPFGLALSSTFAALLIHFGITLIEDKESNETPHEND